MNGSEGTILRTFYGPFCHENASDAGDTLMKIGFDVVAYERATWWKPQTWFVSRLEAVFSVASQSGETVLDIVEQSFRYSYPRRWRLHHRRT